jgi:ADP-heptose:LPS heptosyltransferase
LSLKVRLLSRRAPGDVVASTAVVRDLKRLLGSKIEIDVETTHPAVWLYNPHLVDLRRRRDAPVVELNYQPGIRHSMMGMDHPHLQCHFLFWHHRAVGAHLGIDIPPTDPFPDLHFGPEEKERLIASRYWVVIGGSKFDITVKHWPTTYYREVVQQLKRCGIHCIQCGYNDPRHRHPWIPEAFDLRGKTSLREFIRLIRDADGVIGPITGATHIAAACRRPCVVVAGGREEPWWVAYNNDHRGLAGKTVDPPHRFLHSVGRMPCCEKKGCWARHVVSEQCRRPTETKNLCMFPDAAEQPAVARCMKEITPDQVVEAVLGYYRDGTLPPPDRTPIIFDRVALYEERRVDVTTEQTSRMPTPVPNLSSTPLAGKISVALYWNTTDVHEQRRALTALLQTVHPSQLDLIIVGADPGILATTTLELPEYRGFFGAQYGPRFEAMRKVLEDAADTSLPPYLVWWEGDVWCVFRDWLAELASLTSRNIGLPIGVYGFPLVHEFGPAQDLGRAGLDAPLWVQEGPWYGEKPFRDRLGDGVANGDVICSVAPGWFVLSRTAAVASKFPDPRLWNSGSFAIGEQLWQNGWGQRAVNTEQEWFRGGLTGKAESLDDFLI